VSEGNIDTGEDLAIAEFATLIARTVGYRVDIVLDTGGPDGRPRKLLDVSGMRALCWEPRISLAEANRVRWQAYVAGLSG